MKRSKFTQFIITYVVLGFSLWSGFIGKFDVMVTSFLSFALMYFISNFDKLSEFKASASGFEAKTRRVIEKAEITIEELQKIGQILAETELSLVIRNGRLGGFSIDDREQYKDKVMQILNELSITKSEQEEILSGDWKKFISYDYVHYILGGSRRPQGFLKEVEEEWNELKNIDKIPSPKKLRKFLKKIDCLTEERDEYIKDYIFFLENLEHRRPKVWQEHEKWEPLRKK